MLPGFKNADPAHTDFQYIEDLSCAYWYSEVLFTALELKIFLYLDKGHAQLPALAQASSCNEPALSRLLRCMETMALVSSHNGEWFNSQVSARYLVPGKDGYMGDFFLYRHYMRPNWANLSDTVSLSDRPEPGKLAYRDRNFLYVKSMDTLVKQKAKEIAGLIPKNGISGPILDIGGGAGSMARELKAVLDTGTAVLFDLPEVIEAACRLYPEKEDWSGISTMAGDFRTHVFDETFGLIIMSNFLHAYNRDEAKDLLKKAVTLLKKDGRIIIHDYFPDRRGGVNPQKGALYDLSMMLNTYNGACHETGAVSRWLSEFGMGNLETADLETDTAVLTAGGDKKIGINRDPWVDWALDLGFDLATTVSPRDIVTAPWVALKCRYGCDRYGKNLQCPPHGMPYEETRAVVDAYDCALLVQGAPPGRQFHDRLLALEKQAFLNGYPKALVFGAGPCPACPSCPEDGKCRHHALARPAMESCGIDVYTTVKNAGWSLEPVMEKGNYIKYVGLLMVE